MPPILEPITATNAMIYKAIRLRALQDSPSAFGSTYARESQFTDSEWIKRATERNSDRAVGFLAMDDGVVCGIVVAILTDEDSSKAGIYSMWVAPTHRRSGVGRTLIDAVRAWAKNRGVKTLRLDVTSNNQIAIDFYQRIGFSMTGETAPYPNDPALIEYEMSMLLAAR